MRPNTVGPLILCAVQMEDREHRAVAVRVEEPHALPRSFERTGLGFAVADHARDDQVGVVERSAERVHQRVAELATFVDRSGRGALTWLGMPPGVEN